MDKIIHLLVVDDDIEIRELLVKTLEKYNYLVSSAQDGVVMYEVLRQQQIDLIILDVMMPGKDGLSLCQELRAESNIPIIILTAMADDTDRIVGLEIGADDYITKPFNPRELIARIKAIIRRVGQNKINKESTSTEDKAFSVVKFSGWTLDVAKRHLLSPDNVEITLSASEYLLLMAFINHSQRVLNRDQLLDITHNRPAGPFDRAIDVQVSRLRQKLEINPKQPSIIKTVRGGGYLFTPELEYTYNNSWHKA